MPREPTHPTIEDVPVMEGTCQRRTGEIIAIQKKTLTAINGHVSFHKGLETAKSQGWARIGNIAKLIGLVVMVASLLGTLIWNTATTLKAAEMAEQAAKKVNGE